MSRTRRLSRRQSALLVAHRNLLWIPVFFQSELLSLFRSPQDSCVACLPSLWLLFIEFASVLVDFVVLVGPRRALFSRRSDS